VDLYIHSHFVFILFTTQKTCEEKLPKFYKNNYPKTEKNAIKLKNDEKLPKITYVMYIFITSGSSPGFIYLRNSHRIQRKKCGMSSKSGPWESLFSMQSR
jgi:hypothetical protein